MSDVSAPRPPAAAPPVSNSLKAYTTLRLGGAADTLLVATETAQVLAAVRGTAGTPVLILAGGSNVVIGDDGYRGTVLVLRTRGVQVVDNDPGQVTVRVAAGEGWDDFVARTVAEGWSGVECLSGIPGSVGATPIQNVGAYGQEVADTIVAVHVFDRLHGTTEVLSAAQCRFGYRTSIFKHSDRWVVLEVDFRLAVSAESAPVRYPELARALGGAVGDRLPLAQVRAAVRALRAGKGMVLDPADPDTWSVGSFFVNPVLSATAWAGLRSRCVDLGEPPSWPGADGTVKLSAAWLIERAGFPKGYPGPGGVAISGKHTLALTNRGGGTTGALLALAREIRDGVADRFGVRLHPEPVLVGCEF